ncbi:Fibronectin domain-containing protein, partial [Oryctes borbonicus]
DIDRQDLSIELTSTTFSMKVNVHSSLCPLHLYEFTVRNDSFKRTGVLKTENRVGQLTPNSTYILTISKSGRVIVEERYKAVNTGEVQNVQITEIGDRYVTLKWQEPLHSFGAVVNYTLEYKIARYLNCEGTSGTVASDNLTTTNKGITIRNLHPYAKYTMKIRAFTGPPTTIRFNTKFSNISKEDVPIMQFSELEGKLTVNLTWDCKRQNGPTEYDLLLFCESDWCNGQVARSSNSTFHKLKSKLRVDFDILGFTMYRIELKIFRGNFPPFSVHKPYMSEVPGKVLNLTIHSVNRSSIGVRWRPPHSPSTVVHNYKVEARPDPERFHRIVRTTCDPQNYCKAWKGYICCTCGNLEQNVTYTITVKSLSIHQSVSTRTARASATTMDLAPGKPQNITLNWDEGYNLTVKWLYPFYPNGPLTRFIIFRNNKEIGWYNIHEELPEYEYRIDAQDLTSQEIIIKIGAQNAISVSYADDVYTTSPPRKPNFVAEPRLEETTASLVRIVMSDVVNQEGICEMFAILTDLHPSAEIGDLRHEKFFKEIGVGLSSWFIAGVNSSYGFPKEISYHNERSGQLAYVKGSEIPGGLLRKGHSYQITIVLRNTFEKLSRQRTYRLDFALDSPLYLFALLLIPVVLIVVLIFVSIRYFCINETSGLKALLSCKRQSTAKNSLSEDDAHVYETPREMFVGPSESNPSGPSHPTTGSTLTSKFPSFKMLPFKCPKYKTRVNIKNLDNYIRMGMNNGEFAKQFEEITKCPVKPSKHGSTPENRLKNMIPDLAAYDHSRVKLQNIYEDPYADYINANYINGYDGRKSYIATQGPKDNTINDFWRMIWDEKVQHIIVVSGVIERAQRKFEKYWPEINGFEFFDEIKVSYVRVKVFVNYEIRYFDLVRWDNARQVKQICFTCSPDIGTFQYIRSFASFSKRILSLKIAESPILVHGRGGFGRTGILILCDICLRMALAEGKVDVYHHLYQLREQRMNMVENVQQYKIAHFVLLLILQCISAPLETGIVCTKTMGNEIEDAIATKIEKQLKFLDDSAWQDEAMSSLSLDIDCRAVNPIRRLKFKLDDFSEASFYPYYQFENDSQIYIRAEIVDSFSIPSRYVTTKNPTASTLSVFWQLIIEKQIKMIVCLHKLNPLDTAACMFYPTSNAFSFNPLPNTCVRFVSKYNNGYCDIYDITVTYEDKPQVCIKYKVGKDVFLIDTICIF